MTDWASLALGWLLTYWVHSSLLLGGIFVAERWGRIRSGALLSGLWRAAFFGAILTASLQMILATSPLQGRMPVAAAQPPPIQAASHLVADNRPRLIQPENSSNFPPASPTVRAEPDGKLRQARAAKPKRILRLRPSSSAQSLPRTRSRAERISSIDSYSGLATWLARHWPRLVALTWLAIALILLARIGITARAARRELAGRARLRKGPAFDSLAALSHEAGFRRSPPLSVSTSIAGPVSLPNGEIVLSAWTLKTLTPAELRALLAHELAHCRRRDPLWQIAAIIVGALLFFQPLNRPARARLAAGAELACDDWAAARTGNRRALAECLAACAKRLQASKLPAFASAMAASDSELARRIARLTRATGLFKGEIAMKTRIAILIALIVPALLAPGFLVVPSFAKTPSAPAVSAPFPASAGRQMAMAKKAFAQARHELQRAQAKLARQRARLEAEERSLQKAAQFAQAQAAKQQAKAARSQAKVAARQAAAVRKQAARARRAERRAQAQMQRERSGDNAPAGATSCSVIGDNGVILAVHGASAGSIPFVPVSVIRTAPYWWPKMTTAPPFLSLARAEPSRCTRTESLPSMPPRTTWQDSPTAPNSRSRRAKAVRRAGRSSTASRARLRGTITSTANRGRSMPRRDNGSPMLFLRFCATRPSMPRHASRAY
jgi:beta-lactamase regulating signal transducer with metallopeptidase domain